MINKAIKLVIWDMDETFWKGTISEGPVEIPEFNVNIIKELNKRGIICSISSKNDEEVVKAVLVEKEIYDYFVFPHINWMSKGEQVKDIIEKCQLRDENVLFIDDNPHNLHEAKAVCPKLNIAGPDIIPEILLMDSFKGKNDEKLERLTQYKQLEEKTVARQSFSSNEEFLYQSNIRCLIKTDCLKNIDRIEELINRTNQLNYTKVRVTRAELEELLNDNGYKNYYISVTDNYGDYGIVGFVSLKDNVAVHFLFSCRTIGLGIENYVYAKLNYPRVDVVGEVISNLDINADTKWINLDIEEKHIASQKGKRKRILIHGGCDLSQMEPYLDNVDIVCEYNRNSFHRDHSVFVLDRGEKFDKIKDELIKKVPFLYAQSFDTELFSDKNDFVIISLLNEYFQAVYQYKMDRNIKLAYGTFLNPPSIENCNDIDSHRWFFDNFEFVGRTSVDDLTHYLDFILNNKAKHTKVILINGGEVEHGKMEEKGLIEVHREMNKIVDEYVQTHDDIFLLDIRKFVKSREDLLDTARHYKRNIYYEMAVELVQIMEKEAGSGVGVNANILHTLYRRIVRKINKEL